MTRPAELGKRKHRGLLEELFFLDQALTAALRATLGEVARLQASTGRPSYGELVQLLGTMGEKLTACHGVHLEMQALIERAPDGEEAIQAQIDELRRQIEWLKEEI